MSANELITAPTSEPVTAVTARLACRIDDVVFDDLINIYIRQAREAAEHATGRKFIAQTWEMRLDAFPENEIKLPFFPVQSIANVKYLDATGALITLNSANYTLLKDSLEAWCILSAGQSWPTTYDAPAAVRIQFVAGYASEALIPRSVHAFILAAVAYWIQNPTGVDSTPGANAKQAALPQIIYAALLNDIWIPVL